VIENGMNEPSETKFKMISLDYSDLRNYQAHSPLRKKSAEALDENAMYAHA
jgi:hypothetical protein